MNRNANYYEGDFRIEGAILHMLRPKQAKFAAQLVGVKPQFPIPEGSKPTARELDSTMTQVIGECRALGMNDADIEESIRSNLQIYGFDDGTFPVSKWLQGAGE